MARARDRATAIAGGLAALSAVVLLGGAPRWAMALVAVLTAIAVLPVLASRRAFTRRSPLLALIGLAIALCALQLVPLPGAVIALLQPVGDRLRSDGAALAGVAPWTALTLDAPGTLRALATLVILLGVAWLALRQSVSELGRYRVLASVGALCGVTAAIVGVHALTGATALYGVYVPAQARPAVLGPLLNENHLGSLMAFGAVLAGGLAAYRRQPSWRRVTWVIVAAGCGVAAVATHSRGAALALAVGAAILAGTLLAQRLIPSTQAGVSRRQAWLTTSLPIGVVIACTLVVVVYASASSVSDQLARTSLAELSQPRSKFAIWASTRTLVEETPWVGVGRGAFEPAFTRVHPAAAVSSFSHVENEYVQAIVDWGIPGAIAVAIALFIVVTAALRRWRDGPLAAGALGALAVIGAQSMFDFGVQLLGVAVPVIAVTATLTYVPLKELAGRAAVRARLSRAALAGTLIVAAAVLVSDVTTSVAEDHARLRALEAPTLADVEDALARHPLDYLGYAVAARALARDGDPRAVRFLNHALRLHPTHAALHHFAARLLVRAGRHEQAAVEYGIALRFAPVAPPLLEEVLARLPATLASRAIPTELAARPDVLAWIADTAPPEVAHVWFRRVLDGGSERTRVCERLASVASRANDAASARLAGTRCTTHLRPAQRVELGALLLRARELDAAAAAVADAPTWPRTSERVAGWLLRCDVTTAQGATDDARRCLLELELSGGADAAVQAQIASRLSALPAGP